MNSTSLGLRISGLIFAIICLAHLLRFVTQTQVTFGGVRLPLWASLVVAVVSGALAGWLWALPRLGEHAGQPHPML